MGYKMKGINSFGEGTPLLQKKTKGIIGQDTGNVGTDGDGKAYSIASESNQSGVNASDTIFIPPAYHGNIQTRPGVNTAADTGEDEYLTDEDYTLTETKGSTNRKKGPKSYNISGGYKNTKTKIAE